MYYFRFIIIYYQCHYCEFTTALLLVTLVVTLIVTLIVLFYEG